MKTVSLTVNHADIDRSRDCDGMPCPLEIVARRSGYPKAQVGFRSWCPRDLSGPQFKLPVDAYEFRRAFDAGRHVVTPQTFLLQVEE